MLGGVEGLSNRKILSQMEKDVEALDMKRYEEVAEAVSQKKVGEIAEVYRREDSHKQSKAYEQYQLLSYSQKHKLMQQKEDELRKELTSIKERDLFEHFEEYSAAPLASFRLPVVESLVSKRKLQEGSHNNQQEAEEAAAYFSHKLKEKEDIQDLKHKRKLLIEEETFMSKMKDIDAKHFRELRKQAPQPDTPDSPEALKEQAATARETEHDLLDKGAVAVIRQEKLVFEEKGREPERRASSTARAYPDKRGKQSRLLFQEIFVKPKQHKLDQLLKSHQRSRSQAELKAGAGYSCGRLKRGLLPREETDTGSPRRGAIKLRWEEEEAAHSRRPKTPLQKRNPKMTKRIQKELDDIEKEQEAKPLDLTLIFGKPAEDDQCDDILAFLYGMFAAPRQRAGEAEEEYRSFFGQQLAIRPPEKISGTGGVKAIPATKHFGATFSTDAAVGRSSLVGTEHTRSQSTIKDLKMRVACGIEQGDVSKEAHVVLCLGLMLEEQQHPAEAARFYKRFYFCARLLEETDACALAINRLGVLYFKLGYPNRSLRYHLTHLQLSCEQDLFVSHYNIAVSLRGFRRFNKAIDRFLTALDFANRFNDLEQQCYASAQVGLTYLFIATERAASHALPYLRKSIAAARKVNAYRALFEGLLCLGTAHYVLKESTETEANLREAFLLSKAFQCASLSERCLCNIGIALGRLKAKQEQDLKALRIRSVERASSRLSLRDNVLQKHLSQKFHPLELTAYPPTTNLI